MIRLILICIPFSSFSSLAHCSFAYYGRVDNSGNIRRLQSVHRRSLLLTASIAHRHRFHFDVRRNIGRLWCGQGECHANQFGKLALIYLTPIINDAIISILR